MNPILQFLNKQQPAPINNANVQSPEEAKQKVLGMVDKMSPAQKASLSKMLPIINRVAQQKGVDTSALSELQSRM